MRNAEERYKKFLQDYAYFDEAEAEERKDEEIEQIFLDMCDYWCGDWKDFEAREIKSIFERVNIFTKNIALKYLLEKGYDIENMLYLLGGDMNNENLFELNEEYIKNKDNNEKFKYLGK